MLSSVINLRAEVRGSFRDSSFLWVGGPVTAEATRTLSMYKLMFIPCCSYSLKLMCVNSHRCIPMQDVTCADSIMPS